MDYTPEPNVSVTTEDYYPEILASPCHTAFTQKSSSLLLALFYCLLFGFGLLGNTLVILVLVACKKLRSMTDVYLLNLAISDLLFVFSFPFLTHYTLDQWVFGNIMCKTISGIYYIGFFSSIFFITIMSMDRYLAIVHAVYALKVRTTRKGMAVSLLVWMVATLASVPLLVFYQVSSEEGTLKCYSFYDDRTIEWKLITHFEINILGLVIPLSILVFCYANILRHLKGCQNRHKIKAIRLVLVVVVAFFLFWVPFNMMLFLNSLHNLHILDGCDLSQKLTQATQITEVISFTHCCVNPVIYAFAGEKFKNHLSEIFWKYKGYFWVCKERFTSNEYVDRSSVNQPSSRSSITDYIL
ncbi:C-C chemokine receptor type 8-like [Monodelphis domestica]|uniref:C-C chemokine receptor type 8-like n=1 Tax=Monodelphis domestica TaxID=13616 RepID=UPI0000F2E5E0|nr:C-C chemokine receptor type 8-like [Monodelphis domestica]